MKTWLELHVDDVALAGNPSRWPDAAALIDQMARIAEEEGSQLSIRVRQWFSSGDNTCFLRDLIRRGHEVGAHAHGRDLAASVRALAGAGIVSPVMAPGLVQVGERGRISLLEQARALGAQVITDRLEARLFSYQGWLAWEPLPGIVQLDVSVSPFDWGVLHRRWGKVEPAFGRLDWAALGTLARIQSGWHPPAGARASFGATLHEHDLCTPDSFVPVPGALDGFRRWISRWRPQPSLSVTEGNAEASQPRAVRLPQGFSPSTPPDRPKPQALTAAGPPRPGAPRRARTGPTRASAAVVLVHAGGSGLVERLHFLGLEPESFPNAAFWFFERTPGVDRAPGNPIHLADTRGVLETALSERVPTWVLSWSGGCVPAARVIGDLRRCNPHLATYIAGFIDIEGPVDRYSLLPPGRPGHEWANVSPHDDPHWRGRELVELLPRLSAGNILPTPYIRVQGSPDHVHGRCDWHAERALDAAQSAGLPTAYWRFDQPLSKAAGEMAARLGELLGARKR